MLIAFHAPNCFAIGNALPTAAAHTLRGQVPHASVDPSAAPFPRPSLAREDTQGIRHVSPCDTLYR